jgi:hypothetical protein
MLASDPLDPRGALLNEGMTFSNKGNAQYEEKAMA